MPPSCQPAAIMLTDIAGYTALMGSDEQKAFTILNIVLLPVKEAI